MWFEGAGDTLLLELACFQHKAFLFQVCKLYWNTMLTAYPPHQANVPGSQNSRASRVWKGHSAWSSPHNTPAHPHHCIWLRHHQSWAGFAQTTPTQRCQCAMPIAAAGGWDTAQDFLLPPRRVSWKVSQSKGLDCNCSVGSRKLYPFIFLPWFGNGSLAYQKSPLATHSLKSSMSGRLHLVFHQLKIWN